MSKYQDPYYGMDQGVVIEDRTSNIRRASRPVAQPTQRRAGQSATATGSRRPAPQRQPYQTQNQTQRLSADPRSQRTTRTTGDVNRYAPQPQQYDTYDDVQYDPPTEYEYQRSSVPSRSTGQVRRQPVVPQYADEYVEQPRVQRPPRQYVDRPVRQPVYDPHREEKLQPNQQSRRTFLARGVALFATGVVSVGIGASVAGYVNGYLEQYDHQMKEGEHGYTSVSITCGHSDSNERPTKLRTFIDNDGVVVFQECPGGKNPIETDAVTIRSASGTDYSHYDSRIFPEEVGNGKYRIRLHLSTIQASSLMSAAFADYIFVDNNHPDPKKRRFVLQS